uniref:Protein kinase domain-containing protein n=1 Tax=Pseudonaja textilis TaxID=8673 RepID=A0A670Y4K8_PSETE
MVNFCPQCGQKVEEMFHFCPACGGRLPVPEEEPMQITPSPSLKGLHSIAQTLPLVRDYGVVKRQNSGHNFEGYLSSSLLSAWRTRRVAKPWIPSRTSGWLLWSRSVSLSRCPVKISISPYEGKAAFRSPKKERCPCVEPLPEGEILTDLNDKKWRISKLLSQSDLEKWKKQYLMPFLGVPECVGFGVHENSYRFLVFPELGRSLQSVLDDNKNQMTEKAVLQFAVRLLDVLEYLHENEYTHGDLAAENIYVNPADLTVVTLADFSFAFRYSPGGKHVPQRECSRTPHEGTLEFISLDSHRGAAPSRRSDLESLGYCLVKWLWGALPWSADLTDPCVVTDEKERCVHTCNRWQLPAVRKKARDISATTSQGCGTY